MVLLVSTPGILFVLYATHKIYHARVKFPDPNQSDDSDDSDADDTYISSANKGRRRNLSETPPIYITEHRASALKRERHRTSTDRWKGNEWELRKRKGRPDDNREEGDSKFLPHAPKKRLLGDR